VNFCRNEPSAEAVSATVISSKRCEVFQVLFGGLESEAKVKGSTIDAAATVAIANVLRDSDHPVDSLFLENFVWH